MRKRISGRGESPPPAGADWLDLATLARAEDPAHPIEAALAPGPGWRAAGPGEQVVRLLFDRPLRLRRARLAFREGEAARTQEFVLRWSADGGATYWDVVRQQYTFSPPGTAEEYRVEIDGVAAVELRITPDVGGGGARASLAEYRLG